MLGNFMLLLSSAEFFSNLSFLKNSFRNTIRVSNGLDSVGPDLDPNSVRKGYQQPTKAAASMVRVKQKVQIINLF